MTGTRVSYFDMIGEAEIISMKHLEEGLQRRKCTCILLPVGLHIKKQLLHWTHFLIPVKLLNAFPHGIFGGYHLHGSVRGQSYILQCIQAGFTVSWNC